MEYVLETPFKYDFTLAYLELYFARVEISVL
jgi:hypothetical protein